MPFTGRKATRKCTQIGLVDNGHRQSSGKAMASESRTLEVRFSTKPHFPSLWHVEISPRFFSTFGRFSPRLRDLADVEISPCEPVSLCTYTKKPFVHKRNVPSRSRMGIKSFRIGLLEACPAVGQPPGRHFLKESLALWTSDIIIPRPADSRDKFPA